MYNSTSVPTKDEKNLAALCHLGTFAGFIIPFGNIIVPLIIWIVKKDESNFINDQGKEVLNFQITLSIALVVLMVLFFTFIGSIPAIIGFISVGIVDVILPIIGAIKASEGEYYRYPFSKTFIQ